MTCDPQERAPLGTINNTLVNRGADAHKSSSLAVASSLNRVIRREVMAYEAAAAAVAPNMPPAHSRRGGQRNQLATVRAARGRSATLKRSAILRSTMSARVPCNRARNAKIACA